MDNTNAADLSNGVFAVLISVTQTIKVQNPLQFPKLPKKLAKRDITKEAVNCTASL